MLPAPSLVAPPPEEISACGERVAVRIHHAPVGAGFEDPARREARGEQKRGTVVEDHGTRGTVDRARLASPAAISVPPETWVPPVYVLVPESDTNPALVDGK